jgi:hypothetical protein
MVLMWRPNELPHFDDINFALFLYTWLMCGSIMILATSAQTLADVRAKKAMAQFINRG